jgi:hypothetical protein
MTALARRLLDRYAPAADLSATVVGVVDADPATVGAALARLPVAATATDAARALGLDDRLALRPRQLGAAPGPQLVYGLVWRLEGLPVPAVALPAFTAPGHVKVVWDLRVEPGAEGSVVTTTRRFTATDARARERLLAGGAIVDAVAGSLAHRLLAALRRGFDDDMAGHVAPAALRVAA